MDLQTYNVRIRDLQRLLNAFFVRKVIPFTHHGTTNLYTADRNKQCQSGKSVQRAGPRRRCCANSCQRGRSLHTLKQGSFWNIPSARWGKFGKSPNTNNCTTLVYVSPNSPQSHTERHLPQITSKVGCACARTFKGGSTTQAQPIAFVGESLRIRRRSLSA